jgi:DNA-directed RNA polymerase subunit RPC12/RpoP
MAQSDEPRCPQCQRQDSLTIIRYLPPRFEQRRFENAQSVWGSWHTSRIGPGAEIECPRCHLRIAVEVGEDWRPPA